MSNEKVSSEREWPELVLGRLQVGYYEMAPTEHGPTETYVPLSSVAERLLSPDTVETAARAEYDDWDTLGDAEREECRAACRRGLAAIAACFEGGTEDE